MTSFLTHRCSMSDTVLMDVIDEECHKYRVLFSYPEYELENCPVCGSVQTRMKRAYESGMTDGRRWHCEGSCESVYRLAPPENVVRITREQVMDMVPTIEEAVEQGVVDIIRRRGISEVER